MTYPWNDPDIQDLWTLTAAESSLMLGMSSKGKLGFAVQLKFMEIHGRFPDGHDEIDPHAVRCSTKLLGSQLTCPARHKTKQPNKCPLTSDLSLTR